MFKHIYQICFLYLLCLIMGSTGFAAELIGEKKTYIMGGAASGLRGASKQDAEATFNIYLSDLFKKARSTLSISTVMYPNSRTLLEAFDNGKIDGFFGTPLEYLSRKDRLCKTLVAIKYKEAAIKQPLLIIARAADGITQLKDFKNTRVSLASYMDAEELYLNTSLLRFNLPQIPEFFSAIRDAKNPNIALMDVFFSKSDITVVRENEYKIAIELNPLLAKKLVILGKSEPYLSTVGAINSKISDSEFINFINEFNKVATSKEGHKLMDIVSVDSVTAVPSAEMNDLQELLVENAALRRALVTTSIKSSTVRSITPAKIKNQL